MFNLKNVVKAVAVTFAASVGVAQAAIDTTAVTTALTDAGTAAGVVGAAALAVYAGIKAFKLIKQAW